MSLLDERTDQRILPAVADGEGGRLAVWCGWVVIGMAGLAPIAGWIAPLTYSVLMALTGLLCLPAVRVADEDRPVAVILLGALIWAAVSSTWSPYHPSKPGNNTILKLAFELPLYWSAICAARRADPALRDRALTVLAWGWAAFALVMLVETATRGVLYKTLHVLYEPIRPDLAESNLGHSSFVLGLLWPVAALGAPTRLRPWFAGLMAVATGVSAFAFGSDAAVISAFMAPLVGFAVLRWPKTVPLGLAAIAAALFLLAPGVVWAVRASGDYQAIQRAIPLSWSMRMGYWSHALDWIMASPFRGWGLEASRTFRPGIVLHPHNGELQAWMELGVVGALIGAAFWIVTFARLARSQRSLGAAAAAASASAYVLFGSLNFGLWQEWWLAVGALVAMVAAMHRDDTVSRRTAA